MYCILHGATNETTNGAQNKNVNNIYNTLTGMYVYIIIIILLSLKSKLYIIQRVYYTTKVYCKPIQYIKHY